MVQPVDRRRVHGTDHLQNSIKVVKFLKNLQDFDDPRHDGNAFLQVLRFYDTPAENKHTHAHRHTHTRVTDQTGAAG